MKKRPSEFEQLINDYHQDNKRIQRQKYQWLTPTKPKGTEDEEDSSKTNEEPKDGERL